MHVRIVTINLSNVTSHCMARQCIKRRCGLKYDSPFITGFGAITSSQRRRSVQLYFPFAPQPMIGPMRLLAFFRTITRQETTFAVPKFLLGGAIEPASLIENRRVILILLTSETVLVLATSGEPRKIHVIRIFRLLFHGMDILGPFLARSPMR